MPQQHQLTKALRSFTIECSVLTLQMVPSRITGEMLEDAILSNLNGVVVKTIVMTREDVLTPEDNRQQQLPL